MRPGKRARGVAHERGVAQRGGAEHDAVDAERERAPRRRPSVAQPAAELHRQRPPTAATIARTAAPFCGPARARAVEIDHVQARAPRARRSARATAAGSAS